VLIEQNREPAHTIAHRLSRTLWAVKGRKQTLRRRGLLG
jgi:hypothetical protein